MSPYLERPLRPRHVVIAEMLANMRDTYMVVDLARGEPYLRETDLGQSFERVVRDLADGQYDFKSDGPVAVLRMSREAPIENVTEKVAEAVLNHIIAADRLYDEEGFLKRSPFLDTAWPEWENRVHPGRAAPREYEPAEAAE